MTTSVLVGVIGSNGWFLIRLMSMPGREIVNKINCPISEHYICRRQFKRAQAFSTAVRIGRLGREFRDTCMD
jgi:hypothetical protein